MQTKLEEARQNLSVEEAKFQKLLSDEDARVNTMFPKPSQYLMLEGEFRDREDEEAYSNERAECLKNRDQERTQCKDALYITNKQGQILVKREIMQPMLDARDTLKKLEEEAAAAALTQPPPTGGNVQQPHDNLPAAVGTGPDEPKKDASEQLRGPK